jgi:hypothetical protein
MAAAGRSRTVLLMHSQAVRDATTIARERNDVSPRSRAGGDLGASTETRPTRRVRPAKTRSPPDGVRRADSPSVYFARNLHLTGVDVKREFT